MAALLLLAACSQASGTTVGVVTAIDGDLEAVSAFTMKHPPRQMRDSVARTELESFIAGE